MIWMKIHNFTYTVIMKILGVGNFSTPSPIEGIIYWWFIVLKTCPKDVNYLTFVLSIFIKYTLLGIAYVFCFVCRFLILVGFPSVLGGSIAHTVSWFFSTINVGLGFALSSLYLYTTFVVPILNRFFDAFELLLFGRTITSTR